MLPVAQKIFSYSFLMLFATDNKSLGGVVVDGLVVASTPSTALLMVVEEDMKGLEILPNNSVSPNNPFVARSPPNWLFSLFVLDDCMQGLRGNDVMRLNASDSMRFEKTRRTIKKNSIFFFHKLRIHDAARSPESRTKASCRKSIAWDMVIYKIAGGRTTTRRSTTFGANGSFFCHLSSWS